MVKRSGPIMIDRKQTNAHALSAFGFKAATQTSSSVMREVRDGNGPRVFTIGYEGRTGENLIAALQEVGVDVLVDVRQRAMSRRADFRGKALAAFCDAAGIDYVGMPDLGSTDELRDALHESGDIAKFMKKFERHARKACVDGLERLAQIATTKTVALLCYERCHDVCHRSVVAQMLSEEIDASICAII